jgi:hypothetical protein
MNRRDFIKLMSVSAASASASKVLAGIPEAEPKIELLEEQPVILQKDDVILFDRVIHTKQYRYRSNGNVSPYGTPGFLESSLEATVKLTDPSGNDINPGDYRDSIMSQVEAGISKCKFLLPDIHDKLFLITSFELHSDRTATICAVQINDYFQKVQNSC